MKLVRILFCIAVAALALGAGRSAFAEDEHHHHAAGGSTKLSLDHGRKWATDEPLRANMTAIRAALSEKKAAIHHGTLAPDDYKALGTTIEAKVATIVAECKLAPAADANLHIVVAELLCGRTFHLDSGRPDFVRILHIHFLRHLASCVVTRVIRICVSFSFETCLLAACLLGLFVVLDVVLGVIVFALILF